MNETTLYHATDSLSIAWRNLKYSTTTLFSRNEKVILSNISGRINFGTLNALMGPSGAGKTTLLRCINQQKTDGISDDSRIYVNKFIQIRSCFITQDVKEHLLMGLTGRESLIYASKIKNRRRNGSYHNRFRETSTQTGRSLLSLETVSVNSSEDSYNLNCEDPHDNNGELFDHKKNVSKILYELMLEDCGDTMVNNYSGGQQKRLAIALELVADDKPNLMCIDEPTSGLDSNSAEQVIQCLRNVTLSHSIATVTSIHQPNSLILSMFDQLYVLAIGGYCVFSGRSDQLKNRLLQCGIECPEDQLPIEILLKYASKQTNNTKEECLPLKNRRIKENVCEDASENTEESNDDKMTLLINSNDETLLSLLKECESDAKLLNRYNNSFSKRKLFSFYHLFYLIHRCTMTLMRYQWRITAAMVTFMLIVALLLIYMFGSDVGDDDGCINVKNNDNMTSESETFQMITEPKVVMNLKCQFFAIVFLLFVTMSCAVLTFPSEVKIFLSEHRNGWYSTGAYYWAKSIIDVPIILLIAYIYAFILYHGTGQITSDWRFFYYAFICIMGMSISMSYGYLIGILSPKNNQIAICSAVAVFLLLTLITGFFVPMSNLSSFVQSLSYLSFVRITFESILITLFGYNRCDNDQLSMIMTKTDLKDDQLIVNLYWLGGHVLGWRIAALLALIWKSNTIKLNCH